MTNIIWRDLQMLKPLGNRVVLEIFEEEVTTASGLVLPESAKEKSQLAKVVAVGEGKLLDNGERLPVEVSVGDQVVFEKYAGAEVTFEGNDYLVLKDSEIIAIVK
jgi:chaperonin GroES